MAKEKKKELELLDLSDLPIPARKVYYPYQKWEKEIPPGKAIEITDDIKPRNASNVGDTIQMAARRQKLNIKAMVRNNRIWIYKEEEVEELD